MAGLTTLDAMPSAVMAGDTLLFSLTNSDYPPPDWTITFSFRKLKAAPIDFAGTPDATNTSHVFRVEASDTATWESGSYSGVARVTHSDGSAATIWRGTLEVKKDLPAQQEDFDSRSVAETIRDNLLARIQGKATQDVLNYTVEGVSIGKMSWDQLMKAYDYWEVRVQQEKSAEASAQGKHARGFIGVTFQPIGWTNP